MQAKVSYTSFFKLTCVRAVKGYKNMIIPFQTDIYHNQIRNTWWIREISVIFTTGSGRLLRVQYIDGCTSQFWKVKKDSLCTMAWSVSELPVKRLQNTLNFEWSFIRRFKVLYERTVYRILQGRLYCVYR
jgi:hypothetical protein